MQNIIEICKELGIEVPEDKQKELNSKVSANYKTVAEFEGKIEKLEADRDDWKKKAEDAATTIAGFESQDIDKIKEDAEKWKTSYENLVAEQKEKAEREELDAAIAQGIKDAKGKNAKAIIANLDLDALKQSKNRDKDIAEALKTLAENEDTAFLFATDPENNRARFTGAKVGGANGLGAQKKLKDMTLDERMKLKREDPELYKSLSQS